MMKEQRLAAMTPMRLVLAVLAMSGASVLCDISAADILDDAAKERVTIEAGTITLGATLYRPAGVSGDMPGIVTAHGSAASDRDGVAFYTYRALQMGFAVLSFDKRGVGESSGEFVRFKVETSEATFADLASDVAFSVRWLSQQPGIDDTRIGLFGGSQAGWIMPLAASMEPLVKFMIVGEGSPVTAGEESVHGHVGHDGMDWDPESIARADTALRNYSGDHGFDPGPLLQEITVPTLWIFGLRDGVIPVNPSLERLEKLIKNGKNNNYVHVFPFGDHNFTNTSTNERYDLTLVSKNWLVELGILE